MDNREIRHYLDRELERLHQKLDTLIRTVTIDTLMTEKTMSAMSDAVDELGTQVQANTDAEASAAGLIGKLADLITQNAGDPTAVRDLATRLKSSADALAASVVANTPAEA